MNRIYFNNAATSYPKPKIVLDAINYYLSNHPINTYRFINSNNNNFIWNAREIIANFINAPNPQNIIFTSGATESLNIAIKGLELENSHIITSVVEHNSVIRPLKTLEKDYNTKLTFVKCDIDGYVNPNDILLSINNKTKAIILTHCSNVTGQIQDIKTISKIAKEHNIFTIIDASQSIGAINIDVTELDIDILCFTGHKSLFGVQGIGGLYLKQGIKLKPLKTGGTGIKSDYLYQPDDLPLLLESGTPNMIGIISITKGIEYIQKIKDISITQHLYNYLHSELSKIKNIILYGKNETKNKIPILCFNLKNNYPDDIAYILDYSFNIELRSGLHCAPLIHKNIGSYPYGNIRLSLSPFNNIQEAEFFIKSIYTIAKSIK